MCDGRIIEGNKLKETKMNKFLISSLLGVSTMSACFGVTYWHCNPNTKVKAPKGSYYSCNDVGGNCHLQVKKCERAHTFYVHAEDRHRAIVAVPKQHCCEYGIVCFKIKEHSQKYSKHCKVGESPGTHCFKCDGLFAKRQNFEGCAVPNKHMYKDDKGCHPLLKQKHEHKQKHK